MTNENGLGAALALTVVVLLAIFAIFWRPPEQRRRNQGDRHQQAQANYSKVVADAWAQRMIKSAEIDKIKAVCTRYGLAFFSPPTLDELVAAVMCQTHRSEDERYMILDEIHLGASHYAKYWEKQVDGVLVEAMKKLAEDQALDVLTGGKDLPPHAPAFTIAHFTEAQAKATGRKAGRTVARLLTEAHNALREGKDHDMLSRLEAVGFYVDQHDMAPTVDDVVDFLEGKANDNSELVNALECVGSDLYLYYMQRRSDSLKLSEKAKQTAPTAELKDWRDAGWSDQQLLDHGWAER